MQAQLKSEGITEMDCLWKAATPTHSTMVTLEDLHRPTEATRHISTLVLIMAEVVRLPVQAFIASQVEKEDILPLDLIFTVANHHLTADRGMGANQLHTAVTLLGRPLCAVHPRKAEECQKVRIANPIRKKMKRAKLIKIKDEEAIDVENAECPKRVMCAPISQNSNEDLMNHHRRCVMPQRK